MVGTTDPDHQGSTNLQVLFGLVLTIIPRTTKTYLPFHQKLGSRFRTGQNWLVKPSVISFDFRCHELCNTREALLSEAGLRSFSGPRIGSVGVSCFVDDFVSRRGKRGAYRLLLEPSFKVAFNDFISSGGLIVCCQKKAHQPFAGLA